MIMNYGFHNASSAQLGIWGLLSIIRDYVKRTLVSFHRNMRNWISLEVSHDTPCLQLPAHRHNPQSAEAKSGALKTHCFGDFRIAYTIWRAGRQCRELCKAILVWGSLELAMAVQVRPQIMKLALTFVSGGHSQMAAVRVFGACHAMRIQFIGK